MRGSAVADMGWAAARAMGLDGLGRRLHREDLLVVCYHGVGGPKDPIDWLLLPEAELDWQLEYLAARYEIQPLDDGLEMLYSGALDRPTACITFDDGYANNLTRALPLLERYRAHATIYLTTGLIGTSEMLWTTAIERGILMSGAEAIRVGDPGIDGPLPGGARRRAIARRIKERLKELPTEKRVGLASEILRQTGAPDAPEAYRLLTHAEVDELDRSGHVALGAHTRSHPILTTATDAELEREIHDSIDDIAHLDNVSRTFAYPNGAFDERAVRAVRDRGCIGAVSTRPGLQSAADERYAVRRLVVGGDIGRARFCAASSGLKGPLGRMLEGTDHV